jgi:hypothetical protein
VFPVLNVSVALGAFEEDVGMLLSFHTPDLGDFKVVGKKAMYKIDVKMSHATSREGELLSRWTSVFGPGASPKGCWRSLYKLPIEKSPPMEDNTWSHSHQYASGTPGSYCWGGVFILCLV